MQISLLLEKITFHPRMNILLFGIERASNPDGRAYGISQELFLIVVDKNGKL
jgi:hypothetical protein